VRQQYGVWSLILIFLAVAVGVVAIARFSKLIALMYIIVSLVSFIIIVYSFCAKCPCRQSECGHVLPGKLTKLLPNRAEGFYTKRDYFGVLIPLLLMLGIPQIWLAARLQLMIIFWALFIIAGVEIAIKICKSCENRYCPINSKRRII
jgi:hypothetical protein